MKTSVKIAICTALALCSVDTALANESTISCGTPSKSGTVTVVVAMTGPDGKAIKPPVSWMASIDKNDTAQQKAEKIRAAAPTTDPRVTIGGVSNAVRATAAANHTITGFAFKSDGTGERSTSNVFSASVDLDGLASLEGSAAGITDSGFPSTVSLGLGPAQASVPLPFGMPADEIEDLLLDQLTQQGALVRLAGVEDELSERYGAAFLGDGRLLVLEEGNQGFWLESDDLELTVDVTGLVDRGLELAIGENYCQANANSTGLPGVMSAHGSVTVALNELHLTASQLPHNQSAYFIASRNAGFIANAGGSNGNLCIGNGTARFVQQVQNSGAGDWVRIQADVTAMPTNPGSSILPGETWRFQCWFRDIDPAPTSNFTDGIWIEWQ